MPNPVQAAAEGLPAISRRKALGLMVAVSVPPTAAVAVAAVQPAEAPFDLQHWLDTAGSNAVITYHAARLAEAMQARDTRRAYFTEVDHQAGFVLVFGREVEEAAR